MFLSIDIGTSSIKSALFNKEAEIVGDQSCSDLLGDVNADGLLNILDIVFIVNIILGSAENVPEADVNQDGDLNILDIVTLANIILT